MIRLGWTRRVAAQLTLIMSLVAGIAPVMAGGLAGEAGSDDLVIARGGRTRAAILLSPDAGPNERAGADDIQRVVEVMSGARPPIVSDTEGVAAALQGEDPVLVVGGLALTLDPSLSRALVAATKPKPILRADAIGIRRAGRRVYVAGNSDLAHGFAAAELLRLWGARWYMPGEFGECIPSEMDLSVGKLDHVQGSPFEVRNFWVSWLGDTEGVEAFKRRNLLTGSGGRPPATHNLGAFTGGLGTRPFDIPITSEATARHVARAIEPLFAAGKDVSLAMEDGLYTSEDPRDRELLALRFDMSFLRPSVTDAMLELYNNVLRDLRVQHPASPSKFGFLAYSNMTQPPVRDMVLDGALFGDLAPIDVDPIHGMDDPRAPDRRAYGDIVRCWSSLLRGQLTIYDYDQGMLVWRDLPAPSHQAFRQDIRHYRDASVLGIDTESRNAIATTFLNLHIRARLMWDPNTDVEALLDEFFGRFYGFAAAPMRRYWQAIYKAWSDTIATEHEFFVIPAIYTPELIDKMRMDLGEAESLAAARSGRTDLDRGERQIRERLRFTRLSFEVITHYAGMTRAAATNGDYAAAVTTGELGLAARDALTAMNSAFTTTRLEEGAAWWPGELDQYRTLRGLTNGEAGTLVRRLPLVWALRRDSDGNGDAQNLTTGPVDLSRWHSAANSVITNPWSRRDFAGDWEEIRTDLYAQAQGVLQPDGTGFRGVLWYRVDVDLGAHETEAPLRLMLAGIVGACRLYANGVVVAQRTQDPLWWFNDYRFEWDTDLTKRVKPGLNEIALACRTDGHVGGLFRRPFLYRPN